MVIPTGGVPGILDREVFNITDQIISTSGVKRKGVNSDELDKMKTTKHANECGIANAVVKDKGEFPCLTDSNFCGWLKKHHSQFGAIVPNSQIVMLYLQREDALFIYLKSLTKILVDLLPICEWQVKLLTAIWFLVF